MMRCTKHLIALVVVIVLTYHGVCQGQQLDVRYTSMSHPCQFGNIMPVMTGENVSVGVHLTYTGPELENDIVWMNVHITPTAWFDDDVAELCSGAEWFRRLQDGDEIEIWCDGLVPPDLELGWYYFVVEYEYAPDRNNYPRASYVQVVRGGGIGACCFGGGCRDETQATCECEPHFLWPGGPVRDTTYQGEGTMCLGDIDGDEQDDACTVLTPPTGACCYDIGCQELTLEECDDLAGGTGWMGIGTSCADVLCQDEWACCRPGHDCFETWPWHCAVDGGGWPQIGVMCTPNPCVEQACCLSDGSCVERVPWECPGTPQGPGVMCSLGLCRPECPGDLNGDGEVSFEDRMHMDFLLMQADYPYEIYEGDPLWDASYDLNDDGVIDFVDRMLLDFILMDVGYPYVLPC